MPDLTPTGEESRARQDISLYADAEVANFNLSPYHWRSSAWFLPGALLLGTGDMGISTAVTSDRYFLEASVCAAATQIAPRTFRDTRPLSLRQARRLAFQALAATEQARTEARSLEALLWRSLAE